MLKPQFLLPLADELVVDLFAGGGGASQGIFQATGRHPDIAVNHDEVAIRVHTANHAETAHHCASVWSVEPRAACAGRRASHALDFVYLETLAGRELARIKVPVMSIAPQGGQSLRISLPLRHPGTGGQAHQHHQRRHHHQASCCSHDWNPLN